MRKPKDLHQEARQESIENKTKKTFFLNKINRAMHQYYTTKQNQSGS